MKTFLALGGMPGSGKDTLTRYIMHNFAFIPIFTSKLIESAGLVSYIRKGQLAPDKEVVKLLQTFIREHFEANRFLGNGSIRNPEQARMVPEMLLDLGFKNIITLNLVCSKETSIHRMKRRALEETGRLDNDDSVWENRFEIYKNQDKINAILSEYGPVIEIDANPHIEDVVAKAGEELSKIINNDDLHEDHPTHGVIPKAPHQIIIP